MQVSMILVAIIIANKLTLPVNSLTSLLSCDSFKNVFARNTCTKFNKSFLCLPGIVNTGLGCKEHCQILHGTEHGACSGNGYCSCCRELDSSGKCKPIACTPTDGSGEENYCKNYMSLVQVGLCNPCSGQKFCQLDCISPLHDPDISNTMGQGCCINGKCYCTLPFNTTS